MATSVWDSISRWCQILSIIGFIVRDLLDMHVSVGLGVREKEVFTRDYDYRVLENLEVRASED